MRNIKKSRIKKSEIFNFHYGDLKEMVFAENFRIFFRKTTPENFELLVFGCIPLAKNLWGLKILWGFKNVSRKIKMAILAKLQNKFVIFD